MLAVALAAAVQASGDPGVTSSPRNRSAVIEIKRVSFALSPTDRVGPLKSGLACLPNGGLFWENLSLPTDVAIRRRISQSLIKWDGFRQDAAFADIASVARRADFLLSATVEAVNARLCVAGLGLGERRPTAELKLRVRWDVIDVHSQKLAYSKSYEVFEPNISFDIRNDAYWLVELIGRSADRLAVEYAPMPIVNTPVSGKIVPSTPNRRIPQAGTTS